MLDLVIRRGTIIDGTGKEARIADVAIQDGVITEVGKISSQAHREIDADGLLVTPGWIDIHTHYDGQATWDAELNPSFSSGVTTAIMGNCGVGFAPVKKEMRQQLIDLMEGVEQIPGSALHAGLAWNWESFSEYLDVLDAMPRSFDIGALLPHGPLRLWAMGPTAKSNKCASGEQLEVMLEVTQNAMRAGAFGFSTSRTPNHRTLDGEMTPDFNVQAAELIEFARIVKEHGGYFELAPEGIAGESPQGYRDEMKLIEKIVSETGVNLHILLTQTETDPTYFFEQLEEISRLNKMYGPVTAQCAGRIGGALMSFLGAHPFQNCPTFEKLQGLTDGHLLNELRRPEIKAKIIEEENPPMTTGAFFSMFPHRLYELDSGLDYEPSPDRAVTAIAAREGRHIREVAYDLILKHSEKPRVYLALANYPDGNLDVVGETLAHPHAVLSLSDAGAHVQAVCDGSIHSFMLAHWARDRKRGKKIDIESIIHIMTQKPARSIGLVDRGVIEPGKKADINIFDRQKIYLDQPRFYTDLPAGATRIMEKVTGYRATMVSGVLTREHDEPTGELPGRLVRYREVS